MVFAENEIVTSSDLPVFSGNDLRKELEMESSKPLPEKVRALEVREIKKALEKAHGVKSQANRNIGPDGENT